MMFLRLIPTHFLRFQVEWDDWQRADGTNTTWSDAVPGANSLAQDWNALQSRRRRTAARTTPEIDLDTISSHMPHDIRTAEDAVAYSDKLREWGLPDDDWDAERNQTRHKSGRSNLVLSDTTKKRKRTVEHGPGGSSMPNYTQPKWSRKAREFGIRVVNEVDDEKAPPVGSDFVYLEDSCIYDRDVSRQDPGFLFGCECEDGCRNPLLCSCLMDSQCIDEDGELCVVYDKKGLFLFTNQLEVVECNKNCTCKGCTNKVVQAPRRKIPLDIFKTPDNGWGVRPTVDVPKGTVLGKYTGLVMKRETASSLAPPKKDYTFDLDARDNDPDCTDRYTICAYSAGNWTRFVNHSCGPTAKVYSVVINSAVHMNTPDLAFVACEDIPAGKEITIDYKPAAAWRNTQRKGKGKEKGGAGETPCICKSDICRGFI
ncbi:hypothetical protein M0805_004824 [Coniferiporia weirii]|nr:hypothetical protein M0805_004824 [Coniferiporia weirii]